jgi:hypothetical protein
MLAEQEDQVVAVVAEVQVLREPLGPLIPQTVE